MSIDFQDIADGVVVSSAEGIITCDQLSYDRHMHTL